MGQQENWYAGVYLVYHEPDRMRIVFVQKKSKEGYGLLYAPGGKRERVLDKTPEDTALRELYEETGLNFFKQRELLEKTSESIKQDYSRYMYKIHVFEKAPETFSSKVPWEIKRVVALDEDEILYPHAPILKLYHQGAKAIITNYKVSKHIAP